MKKVYETYHRSLGITKTVYRILSNENGTIKLRRHIDRELEYKTESGGFVQRTLSSSYHIYMVDLSSGKVYKGITTKQLAQAHIAKEAVAYLETLGYVISGRTAASNVSSNSVPKSPNRQTQIANSETSAKSSSSNYVKNEYSKSVKSDQHGVYVVRSGTIYRPIFPIVYQKFYADGTNIETNEKVKIACQKDSPIISVQTKTGIYEKWFSHGSSGWKPEDYLTW
jgi:hypothetical protein